MSTKLEGRARGPTPPWTPRLQAQPELECRIDAGHQRRIERTQTLAKAITPQGLDLVDHDLRWAIEPVRARRLDREPEQGRVDQRRRHGADRETGVSVVEQIRLNDHGWARLSVVTRRNHEHEVSTAGGQFCAVHPVSSEGRSTVGARLASKDWRCASATLASRKRRSASRASSLFGRPVARANHSRRRASSGSRRTPSIESLALTAPPLLNNCSTFWRDARRRRSPKPPQKGASAPQSADPVGRSLHPESRCG